MTTKTLTDSITLALSELILFARGATQAHVAGESATVHLIKAAIHGKDHFIEVVDKLYGLIRTDADGMAATVRAERNEKGDGFTIPAHIRTPVSQVLRAVKFNVPLGTIDKPRNPKTVRDEAKAAADKAAKAATAAAAPPATPEAILRHKVLGALAQVTEIVEKAHGEKLSLLSAAVATLATEVTAIHAKFSPKPKAVEQQAAQAAPVAAAAPVPAAMPEATPVGAESAPVTRKRNRKAA